MDTHERFAFVQMLKARLARPSRSKTEVVARLKSNGLLTATGALAPAYGGVGTRDPLDFEMAPSSTITTRTRSAAKRTVAVGRKTAAKKVKRKAGA